MTSVASMYRSTTRTGVVEADGQILVDGVPVSWTRPGLDPDLASEQPFLGSFLAADGSRALGITSRLLLDGPHDVLIIDVAPTGDWVDAGPFPIDPTPGLSASTATFRAASGELDRVVCDQDGTLRVHDITAGVMQIVPGADAPAWLSEDGTTLVHQGPSGLVVTTLDAPIPLAEQMPPPVRFLSATPGDGEVHLNWSTALSIVPIDRYLVRVEPGGRSRRLRWVIHGTPLTAD